MCIVPTFLQDFSTNWRGLRSLHQAVLWMLLTAVFLWHIQTTCFGFYTGSFVLGHVGSVLVRALEILLPDP